MKATPCFLAGILSLSSLQGQTPRAAPVGPDPFADPPEAGTGAAATPEVPANQNLSVRYEVFSLDLATAATLQRENPGDGATYERMVAMTARKEARHEAMTIVRCWTQNKAVSQSIAEMKFPTEFEPPELPNTIGVSILPPVSPTADDNPPAIPDTAKLKDAPHASQFEGISTPAHPTAFEEYQTGRTFEVEATLVPETGKIELRMAATDQTFAGMTTAGQGLSKVETPEMESQNLSTAATVTPGKPFLLGTMNRPPVSKVDADSANRIWFAFVTVDSVKP
jgi:hypothetical protein